jgi:hypothetical protein
MRPHHWFSMQHYSWSTKLGCYGRDNNPNVDDIAGGRHIPSLGQSPHPTRLPGKSRLGTCLSSAHWHLWTSTKGTKVVLDYLHPPTASQSMMPSTRRKPLPLKQRTSSLDQRRDYSSETWLSVVGLLKPREFLVTVDHFSIWRRHVGKVLVVAR